MKRRDFLRLSSLVSTSALIPGFLQANNMPFPTSFTYNGKRLIIIQLSGGNDGLNTIIPTQNDIYYKLRPTIGIASKNTISINDEAGFNKNLKHTADLLQSGDLLVINGVGYPNPNRSHFRSMDIWHTASDSNEYKQQGWLGNYLDDNCQNDCISPLAIEINGSLSLALKGKENKGLAFKNVRQYKKLNDAPLNAFLAQQTTFENAEQQFLYKTLKQTYNSSEYIFEKIGKKKSLTNFPNTKIGRKLKTVTECVLNDFETKVYYTSISGFDTHSRQEAKQNRLLKQFDEALHTMVKQLKENNQWNNTRIMVFSEFGRRVKENGSKGTDHGAGNNLFVLGGNLKRTGFYNELPNLEKLYKGDLAMQVDFRQVYATFLEDWMEQNSYKILGKNFNKLSF